MKLTEILDDDLPEKTRKFIADLKEFIIKYAMKPGSNFGITLNTIRASSGEFNLKLYTLYDKFDLNDMHDGENDELAKRIAARVKAIPAQKGLYETLEFIDNKTEFKLVGTITSGHFIDDGEDLFKEIKFPLSELDAKKMPKTNGSIVRFKVEEK